MSFTIDDVIQSARDITGNKPDVLQGEQFVPDEAIKAALQDAIIECNGAFSSSTSEKEKVFWTTSGQTLSAPTPVLTPQTSAGSLAAGTYQYQITALSGGGETLAGTATAATLASTGQVVVTWPAVTGATSYNLYGRVVGSPGFLQNTAALTWTDTGVVRPTGAIPQSSTIGTNGAILQDYDVAGYIGTDVEQIIQVLRSDSYVDENAYLTSTVEPKTGRPYGRAALIQQGLQQDAFESIVAIARREREDRYSWAVVNVGGLPALRLMPPPTSSVLILVKYLATSEAIETLPDEARVALNYAAVVAILDTVMNKIRSQPNMLQDMDERQLLAWTTMLEKQRDRYEAKYRAAIGKRAQG